jgi:DNA topoisomerase-2
LKRIIEGKKPKEMIPWYRHFTGSIEKLEDSKYISRANYEIVNDDTIHIIDLPIGVWTDDYKAFLDNLIFPTAENSGKKKTSKKNDSKSKTSKTSQTAKVSKENTIASSIKKYTDDCTDIRVSFTIYFKPGELKKYLKNGDLEKELKLIKPITMTNMYLFDRNRKIRKYDSYSDILNEFSELRLDTYQKRKEFLLKRLKKEINILNWKLKFIESVINEEIIIFSHGKSKTKEEILNELEKLEYPKFMIGSETEESYNYITSIPLFHLTKKEVEKLRDQVEKKKTELNSIKKKTPSEMWIEELDDFMIDYDNWEKAKDKEYNELLVQKSRKIKK